MSFLTIVAISDVHGKFNKLEIPECDILISCGDYSFVGQDHEIRNFHKWLDKQPAKHIISVQGNHERGVQAQFSLSEQLAKDVCPRVHFIDEGLIELEGLKIWCSAYTPTFFNWAYMKDRGPEIKEHWDRIPDDTDILVTHGPPYGILDKVEIQHPSGHIIEKFTGCVDLLDRVKQLPKLQAHFFGHIHEGHGKDGIFHNVSICDEHYKPINEPRIVEIKKPQ